MGRAIHHNWVLSHPPSRGVRWVQQQSPVRSKSYIRDRIQTKLQSTSKLCEQMAHTPVIHCYCADTPSLVPIYATGWLPHDLLIKEGKAWALVTDRELDRWVPTQKRTAAAPYLTQGHPCPELTTLWLHSCLDGKEKGRKGQIHFLIRVKYKGHNIYSFNHFQAYRLMALSTFSLLWNHHHPSPEHFHLSKWKPCTHETLTPHPLPSIPATTILLSRNLTSLGSSYRWNHTVFFPLVTGLFYLV